MPSQPTHPPEKKYLAFSASYEIKLFAVSNC